MFASFRATRGDTYLGVIRLVVSHSVLNPVSQALGTEQPEELRALLTAYTIARVEVELQIPDRLTELESSNVLLIAVDEQAALDLSAGFVVKHCDRQIRMERDLWCLAASPQDETATHQIGGSLAAPTSTPICAACDLPDSRLRCSAFMHPSISATRAFGGDHERSLSWALCDAGHRDLVTSHPQGCIPESGHDCWRRVIDIDGDEHAVILDPLALPDALDRLDDVWRLAFGSHVVAIRSGLDAATLALKGATREAVMDRLLSGEPSPRASTPS